MDNLQRVSSDTSQSKKKKNLLGASHGSRVIVKTNSTSLKQEWQKAQVTPLIKVVHIYNPTVIKTDAANFRALVQKLTGNSSRNVFRAQSSKSLNKGARLRKKISQLQYPFVSKSSATSTPRFSETSEDSSGSRSTESNAGDTINFLTAAKTVYIPERFGTFNDLDVSSALISSLQPLESYLLPAL